MASDLTTSYNSALAPLPQSTTAAQQSQNNNSAFVQVLSALTAAGVNSVTSGLGGGVAGNLVSSLLGGTTSSSTDPSFQANLAAETQMQQELMSEQMTMNDMSQKYTAATNIQQSAHDAAMSVIRNIKA